MLTLFLLTLKALQPWKYRFITMRTDNGLVFVGVGKHREVKKFEEILENKYLEHIEQYIRKHE